MAWAGRVRFLVVYITEAHASDEWPVGALTSVTTQPTSLEHRLQLARTVHTELLGGQGDPAEEDGGSLRVVCDTMSNNFEQTMAAWPIRMYILDPRSGEMLYKAQPDLTPEVYGYSLERMEDWLENYVGKESKAPFDPGSSMASKSASNPAAMNAVEQPSWTTGSPLGLGAAATLGVLLAASAALAST